MLPSPSIDDIFMDAVSSPPQSNTSSNTSSLANFIIPLTPGQHSHSSHTYEAIEGSSSPDRPLRFDDPKTLPGIMLRAMVYDIPERRWQPIGLKEKILVCTGRVT